MSLSVFALLLLMSTCSAVGNIVYDNKEKNVNGDADAGAFYGQASSVIDDDISLYHLAYNNKAISGDGQASSGTRSFFGGSATISDSDFGVTDKSYDNKAKSRGGPAIAGSLFVFNEIDSDSDVFKYSYIYDNTAQVKGSDSTTIAIAGAQTQLGSLEDSKFVNAVYSCGNFARNKGSGDAVAGVENALGSVDGSDVGLYSYTACNDAITNDGTATSGVENGINTVTDSSLYLFGEAISNSAKSIGGNAIAGAQDSINSVSGTFPAGGSKVNIYGFAADNYASALDGGSAVSGVQTNIGSADRTDIDIYTTAYDNFAYTGGDSTLSSDAVSGTQVTVSDIEDSTLNIDTVASGNLAVNKHVSEVDQDDNDAVAGTQVVVGDVVDSNIIVAAESTDNKAISFYGDAIAGNKVEVGYADQDSVVALDLYADNNEAVSINGDAIIDNDVTIGGAANVIGFP